MAVASPGSTKKEAEGFRFAFTFFNADCRLCFSARLVLSISNTAVNRLRTAGHDAFASGFNEASLIIAKTRMRDQ